MYYIQNVSIYDMSLICHNYNKDLSLIYIGGVDCWSIQGLYWYTNANKSHL